MIGSTSCPWAWTQSSRLTPTSLMHNLSFTSRLQQSCVEILSNITTVEDSWKLSGLHGFREGIGSTHRDILETYATSLKSKYHQLKSRARLRKQRIQFTKGIVYPRKGTQGYWIRRTQSNNNPIKDLVVHKGSDVSISTQPEEERMQQDQII